MSEHNTARTRQIAIVETVIAAYRSLGASLERLAPDTLDKGAVDNLRRLHSEMEPHISDLDKSTYKLLD